MGGVPIGVGVRDSVRDSVRVSVRESNTSCVKSHLSDLFIIYMERGFNKTSITSES